MENLEVYGGPISEKDRQKVFKVRVKRTIDFAALKSYAKERFPFLQNSVKIRRNLQVRTNMCQLLATSLVYCCCAMVCGRVGFSTETLQNFTDGTKQKSTCGWLRSCAAVVR